MRRLLILLTIVGAFAAIVGAPTSALAGGCPGDQSVMTSTSNSSAVVKGYVCAQEDHFPDMSIGAGKSHSVTSTATSAYATWYSCHETSSSAVNVGYATAFGSATYTADNTLTPSNTRHWGAGMLWTLGNTTPSGFSKGCSWSSSTMWDHPPAILDVTSISGTYPPTATAGVVANIPVTVSPSSATGLVAVEDHGVPVASAQLSGGKATIPWIPAVDGTSSIVVVYAGSSSKTPAQGSSTHSVTVAGGTGVAISAASGAGATVNLTSGTPVSGTVTLIDTTAKAAIGTANVASFTGSATANVLFSYAPSKSYTMVAVFSNALGQKVGQSYPFTWSSTGASPASRSSSITVAGVPTSTVTAGKAYPITVNVSPASATGIVAVEDAGHAVASATLSGGAATINWTPATDGQSRLTFIYTGDASNPFVMSAPSTSCPAVAATSTAPALPAATNCVPVAGGIGVTISAVAAQSSTSASATVGVTPTTSAGSVVLLNVGTSPPSRLGSATLASGAATIAFPYTAGSLYTVVAKYCTTATTCTGQSYPVTWSSVNGGTSIAAQVARSAARLNTIPTGLEKLAPAAASRQEPLAAEPMADPQVSLVTRRTTSGRAHNVACPAGTRLINADAVTNGPVDDIEFSSYSSTGVRVVPSPSDRGKQVTSQLTCRPRSAKATTSGDIVYGSIFPNRIELAGSLMIGFGGPGKDLMTSTVAGSTLWGGLGHDVLFTEGAGGVVDGGPGADVIIAGGSGTHLLIGGHGRDSITSSFNADLINARDGHGGDVVTCRNPAVRVMADAGDVVTGPCLQVDTINGKGTVAS